VPDEKEVSKLSEQLKDAYTKERGETSTDAIRFSLIHAQKLLSHRRIGNHLMHLTC